MKKRPLRGSLMLLTAAIIWGSAFVAQSEGMAYVEPFTYNAVRTLLGGIVLIPIIFLMRYFGRGQPREPIDRKQTVLGGICCGVILCAASSFQQAGIKETTAGKAGFITALYVVIVPVFSIALRKKPPAAVWLCIAGAVAGFYLLCIREDFTLGRGDLLVLICAFIFALHIMAVDHFCEKHTDPAVMSCIQFFTAGILLTVCMLLFESPKAERILAARNTILYAGILSSGGGYTLQILGQRETSPTAATLLMSLESVFAALSGWLFLHEQLSLREGIGCALVLASVIAAQLLTSGSQKSRNGEQAS